MSSREGKKPVPKFPSFKPKPESETLHGEAEKTHELSRGAGGGEHRVSKAGHSHHRDRHRPAVAASGGSSGPPSLVISQRSAPRQDQDHDRGRDSLFVVDKRGDPLIRRYGSNDRREIPEYRRIGGGRVLGVDGFMTIERVGNREEFFIRGYHEGRSVLGGDRRSLLARGSHNKSIVVRVRKEEYQPATGEEDFLSLRPSKRRKREGDVPEELSADEGPSYRSIHGKAKPHEHSESDEEYDSDSSTGSNWRNAENPMVARSIELSKRVREHPEDIEAWLQLVDHQDVLLGTVSSGGRRPTPAEVKSYADIKLSMLEQALSQVTTDPQRVLLQLKRMSEGAKIWDPKNLEKRWKDVIQKYGSDFEIWRAYMTYRQTTLSTFQYDDIKKLYIERMQFIRSEIASLPASSDQVPLYRQMIYVFLRTTRFIADAGYRELGTALWQAALELTFSRPTAAFEGADDTVLASFEAFWESEVPRIGEDMARGWAMFEADAGAQEPPDPKPSISPPVPTTRDVYKAWSILERYRSSSATLPARTLDDSAEDDPYRVVMFADIRDLLFYVPAHIIPSIRRELLDAFLIFSQLPPAFHSRDSVHGILQDDFLMRRPTLIAQGTANTLQDDPGQIEQTNKNLDFSQDYQSIIRTPEVLFPSPNWFKYITPIKDRIPPEQYRWIANTLKQLVRSLGVKELAPYYLAFESTNEPGNEKKTAKALLKQDPASVDLYEGYAILEWAQSNKAAARNVVAAAMGSQLITDSDRCRLGIAWAWMELEDGALAQSALRLCTLAEGRSRAASAADDDHHGPVAPSRVLKGRNFLATNRDYLFSSGDPEHAIIYAKGLALLEYLTQKSNKESSSESQGDIWSAIASISACSDEFISRGLASSSAHEKLLQFAARLLYFHAGRGPFRAGFLREQLTKYIGLFPRNTIFLGLLAWKETRLGIDDRVRAVLDSTVLTPAHDCLSSRAFAIRHEARTGNAHSARAAFEHAFTFGGGGSEAAAACGNHPGLWISYVRFCQARKELRPKTKDAFYRAVQRCPWSKDVFMEAFAPTTTTTTTGAEAPVHELDSAELGSVYNTLCDKGLRVHIEMPEFVEKWERQQMGRGR
ncbi:hypothetical protein SLS62_006425 [Diatrype stigma]|uniref:DUF1740-domain-containing protein n=1 Tax=Diatrype stigma TaxID=117547 RepID=A0AAN9USQ8_9PEZI